MRFVYNKIAKNNKHFWTELFQMIMFGIVKSYPPPPKKTPPKKQTKWKQNKNKSKQKTKESIRASKICWMIF